jgi:DNA repair protein RadC
VPKPPTRLSIKAWAEEDRPREKLVLKGTQALSDAELIAILVGSGTSEDSAVEVCKKLLHKVEFDLGRLGRMSVEEIIQLNVKGIGKARAVAIAAALELGRRRQSASAEQSRRARNRITSSREIFDYMAPKLADKSHEEFHVIFLNRSNVIITHECMSSGGLAGTVADPRVIFKRALDHKASYIAACHNHPSGNLRPSPADLKLTRSLSEAGRLLDIVLLDHVIVAESSYYSFADDGKL